MILDVNKIQEGECLAWVSSPVRTLAVWTSFNKAVKTIDTWWHQIVVYWVIQIWTGFIIG